ncbi:hypothetical protein ACNY68_12775 [Pantoea sp. KXB25]|uniref:hypothetical protein n=1 Tax=unclassified Pantoea TaxID=2630326 RepID=UPI003AB2276B
MKKMIIVGLSLFFLSMASPIFIYTWFFKDHEISGNTGDWGDFGSYLSGTGGLLLSALSFFGLLITLIITIKNNEETKETSKTTLKETRDNFERQIKLQEQAYKTEKTMRTREYHQNYIQLLVESLNEKLDKKRYYITDPQTKESYIFDEDSFLKNAFGLYDKILAEDKENNKVSGIESFRIGTALDCWYIFENHLWTKYPEEISIIKKLVDIINREESIEVKKDLIHLFHAGTNRDRTFWLLIYTFHRINTFEELFWEIPELLAMPERMMNNPPPLQRAGSTG